MFSWSSKLVFVMVTFMGQLDWATGCLLDILSNMVLGISVDVFWMRLTLESINFE